MFMFTNCPRAKVADGRLVLNLPDAETPALWMMELNDAASSVLRLETDAKGFYVIKKHGGKGAAETVAVYRDRARGTRALGVASKALEKARSIRTNAAGQPVVVSGGGSRFGRYFVYFVMFWLLMYMIGIDKLILRLALMPFLETPMVVSQQRISTAPQQAPEMPPSGLIAPTSNNDIPQQMGAPVGVPLSADDFLDTRKPNQTVN